MSWRIDDSLGGEAISGSGVRIRVKNICYILSFFRAYVGFSLTSLVGRPSANHCTALRRV